MSQLLSDYDYELPAERIAQRPLPERDGSRLLVLRRADGGIEHRAFRDLVDYLRPGDLLVLNETRVFPARLWARRPSGARLELLLLEPGEAPGSWSALARPARALRAGAELPVEADPAVAVRGLGRDEDRVLVAFLRGGRALEPDEVRDLCERAGEVPLPPYIRRAPGEGRDPRDLERYQTVYARNAGAVAAPTAGLHFTPGLLDRVRGAGASVARLTLHVGYGTFKPLTEEVLAGAALHPERLEVEREAGEAILAAMREGRRVVAVGTTAVRGLETFAASGSAPWRGETDLFIKPGHAFRAVGALVTNFHLPRSSLLVLVSAFAGRETVLHAYREAIRESYRFYSYGDAMLIL